MTMRAIHFTACLVVFFVITSPEGALRAEDGLVTPENLPNILNSSKSVERVRACEAIMAKYKESTDEEKLAIRSRYTDAILSVLNSPVGEGEYWNGSTTPRNLAVQLAGALKVVSTIPRLVELLRPLEGERIQPVLRNALKDDLGPPIAPSAEALVLLGDDAKAAVSAAEIQNTSSLRESSIAKSSREYKYRFIKGLSIDYVMEHLRMHSGQE